MKTSKTLLLAAGLFFVLSGSSAAQRPVYNQEGILRDYDLQDADPALCEKSCEEEPLCTAWTYIPPVDQREKARCWLYNHSYPSSLFPISGIKQQYMALPEYETPHAARDLENIQGLLSGQKSFTESLPSIVSMIQGFTAPEAAPTASSRGVRTSKPEQQKIQRSSRISKPTAHVWEYLHSLGTEPSGYATYSYILSGRNGSERYADLVRLIQRSTAEASELEDILLPEELNIFLIPALNTGNATGNSPDLRFSQQVLTVLSARSPLDFNRPGPYIVTLYHPLGQYTRRDQIVDILYVDLTNIHPGAVAEVVRTYKQTVLKKELRGQEKLRSLRLSLLKFAFLAEDSIGFARTAAAAIDTTVFE